MAPVVWSCADAHYDVRNEHSSIGKRRGYLSGLEQEPTQTCRKTCTDYTFVQGSTGDVVWGDSVEDDSWYVVDGQVSIDGRIKVRGDVHLILKDGATLYANKGIYTEGILSDRGNLAIYG